MMNGVYRYPNKINKITTIEMTGIVLKIVTYGFKNSDKFLFKPAKIPKDIPKIPETNMEINNLNNVKRIILSVSKLVRIDKKDDRTDDMDGTSKG